MRLYSGRAGKFESAVGTLYLFHLVLIVAALLVIQSRFDLVRFGVESERQTGDFLPVGKAETYDTDNLYEKIDGKAPMYQETGFVKLTTQRFAGDTNSELGFEQYLYDMGNTRNAFSVYSRQKRADANDLADVPFGYKTSNSIYISHGKYYIEMIGFAESDELLNAMKGIAQKLLTQLPINEKDRITELDFFPSGIVQESIQLQIRDAYGFDGLTDTYSAKYKVNDKAVTIFFSKRSNADEAKKVANSYTAFLTGNDAILTDSNSLAWKAADVMSVFSFFGGTEIVFTADSFVGGVHEADDRDVAMKAANVLSDRLRKISGETGD